jgi:hypothetical protein
MNQTKINQIIQQAEMLADKSDKMYFINKALDYCNTNDIDGIRQSLKRIKLMEQSDIVYRHVKEITGD